MVRLRNTNTSGRASVHESIIIDQKVTQAALRLLCQSVAWSETLVAQTACFVRGWLTLWAAWDGQP